MLQLKNNFKFSFLVWLALIILSNNAFSQNIFTDKTNQKIWEAKDRSDIFYTNYILKKGTSTQKILALKGLLSWHDTIFREPLLKLIKKGNANVKIATLEAIGQSRDSFYISYLLKIIHKRGGAKIKPTALVALGKCITKSKVDKLVEIKNSNQAGYGECIYRAMLKRADHIELKDNMVKLLIEDNIENKFYAAWYLSRTIYPINSENFKEILKLNKYPEPWIAPMPLMVALGKATLNNRDSLIVRDNLISNIFVDKDQKFKDGGLKTVVSFRTFILKKFNFDSTDNWLELNANGITYPPIQLAYSEFISKNCKVFKKYSNLTYGPAIVNILKNPECKNFSLKLPVTNTIYDKIWNLQLLETSYQNYPIINNILMQTESPAVKSAATESLIKCRNTKGFPESLVADFNRTIEILIKDGDEGALSIVANAILDKQLGLDSNYRQLFIEAQSNLKLPQEMEAYIDIAKVLAMMHKTDYKKPEPEWNHAIDWNFVSKIKTDQKIKVTTTQGEFIIQLNVNEAPGSVASILKLVDEGYYNGKFFHRMVPNFVIQGGCPRGDGFGSQDYTIRSEFSSLKYSTGAVGLASAGPDTESCQWFATHCPTPHLDGRYTIIGYVISGMDTVHKLGVGDVILKVIRVTP